MKWLKIFLVFSIFFLQLSSTSAQDEIEPITIPFSETRTLYSEEIDQEFIISVALPYSYFDSETTSYPVMYILDPDISFGTMVDIAVLGAYTSRLPDIIVVGIGYPFPTEERIRDYMQEPEAFLQFIENDLIPVIEGNYRANPSERAIAGWSAGGYFALYALFNNPAIFNRYIVIGTPVVYIDDNIPSITEYEEAFADSPIPLFARVFLSGGRLEPVEVWETFTDRVNSRHYLGLQWATNYIEGADHTTALPTALALGARDIYCFSFLGGCDSVAPLLESIIEDEDFPQGLTFRTPDALIAMKTSPSRTASGAGQCRDMDATVIQVGTVSGDDNIWVQLECGENVGWVQRSRLEN